MKSRAKISFNSFAHICKTDTHVLCSFPDDALIIAETLN